MFFILNLGSNAEEKYQNIMERFTCIAALDKTAFNTDLIQRPSI